MLCAIFKFVQSAVSGALLGVAVVQAVTGHWPDAIGLGAGAACIWIYGLMIELEAK